jgi:hypothetical protein
MKPVNGALAFAAGWRWVNGTESVEEVAQATGVKAHTVRDAAVILRYAPDLCDAVNGGGLSFVVAYTWAAARRAEAKASGEQVEARRLGPRSHAARSRVEQRHEQKAQAHEAAKAERRAERAAARGKVTAETKAYATAARAQVAMERATVAAREAQTAREIARERAHIDRRTRPWQDLSISERRLLWILAEAQRRARDWGLRYVVGGCDHCQRFRRRNEVRQVIVPDEDWEDGQRAAWQCLACDGLIDPMWVPF